MRPNIRVAAGDIAAPKSKQRQPLCNIVSFYNLNGYIQAEYGFKLHVPIEIACNLFTVGS